MKVLGISGWSGCGKTTLIVTLITHLRRRGFTVSTLKHTHHNVDLDTPSKDTWCHREAGAQEVILATSHRWALLHELREEEPTLTALLTHLQPVDLVLVEGWRTEAYPKIEIWRPTTINQPPRFPHDPNIIAVACDLLFDPTEYNRPNLPVFSLTDFNKITNFIISLMTITPIEAIHSSPTAEH